MNFIEVDYEKLPVKHEKLKQYLSLINETRECPVHSVMLVEDDVPRGVVIYSQSGQLLELFVAPEVRRSRLGTALHNYFINSVGDSVPTVFVDPDNTEAQQFLLHHGWRIHGKIKPLYHDNWHLRMTRSAAPAKHVPSQGELACSDFLDGVMVFFAVGTKIY